MSVIEEVAAWTGSLAYILWAVLLLSRSKTGFSRILLPAGWLSYATAIAVRWMDSGQGPFMTLYEVLISNLCTIGLIYNLAITFSRPVSVASPVISSFLAILSIWALKVSPESVPLPATFENYWLWFHVLSGKVFLASLLIATSLALILLFNRLGNFSTNRNAGMIEAAGLSVWQFVALAFLFHSLMLLAGAAWAHDAWGRYWSWDTLETWSLITWLCMAVLLHARATFRIPVKFSYVFINGIFVIAFLTFFGMPFLSIGPHKGIV